MVAIRTASAARPASRALSAPAAIRMGCIPLEGSDPTLRDFYGLDCELTIRTEEATQLRHHTDSYLKSLRDDNVTCRSWRSLAKSETISLCQIPEARTRISQSHIPEACARISVYQIPEACTRFSLLSRQLHFGEWALLLERTLGASHFHL